MNERMSHLHEAVAAVDVLGSAGRIVADPLRRAQATSTAEAYALALAVERFWSICLEAEQLARLEARRAHRFQPNDRADGLARSITQQMAALRGATEESQTNGRDHS